MVRFKKLRLIICILLISVFVGCYPKKDRLDDAEVIHTEKDTFSGHYFNSSKDHLIKSIEILQDKSGYSVLFHYEGDANSYSGLLINHEIVVEEDDHNTFHLYLNAEELRVYKVVQEGYQPEDIDWTFYKSR